MILEGHVSECRSEILAQVVRGYPTLVRSAESMDGCRMARALLRLPAGRPGRAYARRRVRNACAAKEFCRSRGPSGRRYAGFGHLPMQDPRGCRRRAGTLHVGARLAGVMITGTPTAYLDHPALAPFWERAAALESVIISIDRSGDAGAVLDGHKRAAPRTGNGRSRPAARVRWCSAGVRPLSARPRCVGHMARTLPFLLWRLRQPRELYGILSSAAPSDYIGRTSW